ncbi:hypothetical protein PAXINDRAFT_12137 [Paxillus involutus ATCC 200175]|uniref:Uncharacterized protein n=1 Tax=Paxillus involutus ATCC 200175 TaxID=664439 RepID=A0A0C9TY61_PAXIN|nr:hypothetical protein PAXINDRAFT_12137 [Paxillus involutus ATCC 200175]
MEMEDDKRTELLRMDVRRDVATSVNSYPTLGVSFELEKGEYTAGAPILMHVALSRDADEDPEHQTVIPPFYPVKKMAGPTVTSFKYFDAARTSSS